MKIYKSLALGILLNSGVAICASAESFTVQVGAYAKPQASVIEKLEAFGGVNKEARDELTLISVGNFERKDDATSLLNTVQNEGFYDAYIRKVSQPSSSDIEDNNGSYGSESDSDSAISSDLEDDDTSFNDDSSTDAVGGHRHQDGSPHDHTHDAKLSELSEDQRYNAVYLDGRLHIKDGDTFVPVE